MALSHLLYTVFLLCVAISSVLYFTRNHWVPLLPTQLQSQIAQYVAIPQHSFTDDIEAGFTSSEFDLSQNVNDSDDRHGLDSAARKEVKRIMKSKKCTFDQARLIFLQDKMRRAGIDPMTGLPVDRKFVSFG